jgi:hypothetical protein
MANINGEEIYQILKDICKFGYRRIGTPEALNAEKYIQQKLIEVGIPDTKLEEFEFPKWTPNKFELTILSERTPLIASNIVIDTFPYWSTGSTGLNGIEGELVYVGNGTSVDFKSLDVKDKIVLIEGKMLLNFHTTHSALSFNSHRLAKDAGALGVICINGSPLDSISYLFHSSLHGWRRRLPGFSIRDSDGLFLKNLCIKSKVQVKLILDVKKEEGKSNLIIGTLPGKSDDIILVGTHTDSTFTGAIDNASANAGLIALAKYFSEIPLNKRDKTIIFAGWSGHEAGLIGVEKFVKTHKDLLPKISAFIMLDGFASNGYQNQVDGGVIKTGLDEQRGLFVSDNAVLLPVVMEAVLKYRLLPAAYLSAKKLPVSDLSPFIFSNVPSIMIIGKPIWYHTLHDTIDKCTPEQLERSGKAHAQIISNILEIPHKSIKDADGKLTNIREFIKKKEGFSSPSGTFMVFPYPIVQNFSTFFVPLPFQNPDSIIMDVTWDFGDGESNSILLTRHEYKKPGTYEASCTFTDNYDNRFTIKKKVYVINLSYANYKP